MTSPDPTHPLTNADGAADPAWVPGVAFTARLRPSGEIEFESPRVETECLLEVAPDELARRLTERRMPLVRDDEQPFWDSILRSAAELTPWRREVHVRGERTGRDIWFRVHAVPRREPDGTVVWSGLIVDVTDRKITEDRLWRAYRQLTSHMDNTPLAVLEWDHKFLIRRWSEQAERVFGWSAAEVIGKPVFGFPFVHPEDVPLVANAMKDMIETPTLRNRLVNRNLTKAGAEIVCEWYNSVVFDEEGKLISVLSMAMDVTERRRTEESLAHNEALLRGAMEAAGLLVWELDLTTDRYIYSTDYAAFFGLPPGLDYGNRDNARTAVDPDEIAKLHAALQLAIETDGEFHSEFRGATLAADGGRRWFSLRGRIAMRAPGQPVSVRGVLVEVTPRKQAEQQKETFERQLQEAQKLESLGVLAGGVAHDFNNLLTVIIGNAALARKETPDLSPVIGHLDQIETACQRAASLCRQMLAYAGRGKLVVERADLNRLIRDSSAILRVTADSRVRVEFNLTDPLPTVSADLAQLRQVLLNLVLNATEAVAPLGGRVYVRTGVLSIAAGDSPAGCRPPPTPGRYVFLDVADSGPGMPADVLERAFEPFFTTKFTGRGLGLPAVLGIVRAHGGSIRVDTDPGRGTLVRVLWPARDDPPPRLLPQPVATAPPSPSVSQDHAPPPRETGVALIVDDEMFVRELAASTMEEMGFVTLVAANGMAALDLFQQHRAALRVAVIDLIMPGMSGLGVLSQFRTWDPHFPVVLVSGFTDRGLVGKTPGEGPVLFLQKPFRPEELMAAVRSVLAMKGS